MVRIAKRTKKSLSPVSPKGCWHGSLARVGHVRLAGWAWQDGLLDICS